MSEKNGMKVHKNLAKAMQEFNFYVPLNRNDGITITAEALDEIKDDIVTRFGACTLHLSLLGIWINRVGEPYRDRIMIVQVAAEHHPDLESRINAIASLILERLNQECVFVTIRDIGVLSLYNGLNSQH
jgi:hypothetical protein